MWGLFKPSKLSKKESQKLTSAIKTIAGFSPANFELYRLATLHSSRGQEKNGIRESNERLEYLGDAVLGAAVADYLFKKYPFENEGFLTEIRSRIVNRESLNALAKKVGIGSIIQFDQRNAQLQKVILGNTLEAIVGAVYLDKGYLRCKKFVVDKLIVPHFDLDELVSANTNYKSMVIEWAQRNNKPVRFESITKKTGRTNKEFSAQVWIDDKPYGMGYGFTKKKAEQDAALKTSQILNI